MAFFLSETKGFEMRVFEQGHWSYHGGAIFEAFVLLHGDRDNCTQAECL